MGGAAVRRLAWTACTLVVAFSLVAGSASLGLRIPGLSALFPFAQAKGLDYQSPFVADLAPLRTPFIAEALGAALPPVSLREGGGPRSRAPQLPRLPLDDHPLVNDSVAEARQAAVLPYAARTNMAQANREAADPGDCAPVGNTIWYRHTPAASRGLVGATAAEFATVLGVFRGTPQRLDPVGCDSDPQGKAQVSFLAVAGVAYYFQIAAPVGGGELAFSLEPEVTTRLLSADPANRAADGDSRTPKISANGRYVAFQSSAPDLDPAYPCRCGEQVYVRDLATGRTELISRPRGGGLPNGRAVYPDLSADGRYVSFQSKSTNLVPGDTNDAEDVFVLDRRTGRLERVSVNSQGEQGDSPAGHPAHSGIGELSADGRFVVFNSDAWNMIPGGDTNQGYDVFIHDRVTRVTELVSQSSEGVQGNRGSTLGMVSPDARFVVFQSWATNLAPGADYPLSNVRVTGFQYAKYIVYLRDRLRKTTTLVSVSSEEASADDHSFGGNVSADGRYVSFHSYARNLVPGDLPVPDPRSDLSYVYLRDVVAGTTVRLTSVPDPIRRPLYLEGAPLRYSKLSDDGRYVAFVSAASLLSEDTNGVEDVYVLDRVTGRTILGSVGAIERVGNRASGFFDIGPDGRNIVFESMSSNAVTNDDNERYDVYMRS